jgi:hypothetical protein
MIASLPHLTKKEDNIKAFNQYQKITRRRSQTSFRQVRPCRQANPKNVTVKKALITHKMKTYTIEIRKMLAQL